MNSEELREKKEDELKKLLSQKREKLQEVKFNLSSGRVKNVKEARNIKKDIARILTILNEGSYEK
ncbi:MAG: 50S ribosomal protein L29 [Patescibacteria group bacterium]